MIFAKGNSRTSLSYSIVFDWLNARFSAKLQRSTVVTVFHPADSVSASNPTDDSITEALEHLHSQRQSFRYLQLNQPDPDDS